MVKHSNRLYREAGDSPSLEEFKARLNGALNNLVVRDVPGHGRGVGTR